MPAVSFYAWDTKIFKIFLFYMWDSKIKINCSPPRTHKLVVNRQYTLPYPCRSIRIVMNKMI